VFLALAAAYTTLTGLYPVAVGLGLAFGAHWSLVPAICSDVFGGLGGGGPWGCPSPVAAPMPRPKPGLLRCLSENTPAFLPPSPPPGLANFGSNYTTLQVRAAGAARRPAPVPACQPPGRLAAACAALRAHRAPPRPSSHPQPAPCPPPPFPAPRPPQFAPALGSYLLATRLTGRLYDAAAAAHGDPRECVGPDCFREAFLVLAGLAAGGAAACVVLTARSRRLYRLICRHMLEVGVARGERGAQGRCVRWTCQLQAGGA
jgi:hypothetical protein